MVYGALAAFAVAIGMALWVANKLSTTRPVPRNDPAWLRRHQAISDRLKQGRADVLWIGDSIVERFDGPGQPSWDKYYAPRNAVNMGVSGDKTQHVLWRLDHCNLQAVSPKLAIVMIGQNNGHWNTASQIDAGATAIVEKLRRTKPDMKILLLGIFYRGQMPNDEQRKLEQVNDMLARLDDGRHVFYLNVNSVFLNSDGTIKASLMPDYEHPNAAGCQAWAEAIEPKVAELLGEAPIRP